jgi:glycosyltransferase involved in cell wall biosynthesis
VNHFFVFLAKLGLGGSEVQCLKFIQSYSKTKKLVLIYIHEGTLSNEFYNSDADLIKVKIRYKGNKSFIKYICYIIEINKLIKYFKPNIIYSWLQLPNIIIGCIKLYNPSFKFISSIRFGSYPQSNKLFTKIGYYLLGSSYKRSDAIIANSIQGIKSTANRFKINRSKFHIIRNIIDGRIDNPTIIRDDHYHLTFIGRLNYIKNPTLLIKASHYLNDKNKYVIDFYGPEDGITYKEILRQADLAKITINLYGFKKNIFKEVYNKQIIISTSISEGLSNIILESLLYNIPVIATDVGDNSIILNEGRGEIVQSNNPIKLAKAIEKVCDQINNYDFIKSQDYIKSYFSPEYNKKLHDDLFYNK